MGVELEQLFNSDVLAAFDERARRVAEQVLAERRPSAPEQKFITVKEAAKISSHPEGTIRQWLAKGTLRNYGRRRAPRVRLCDILDLGAPRGG